MVPWWSLHLKNSMNNSTMETFTDFRLPENQAFREMYRLLPIAIAIIVSNGLVFYLFYKRKSLRNSSNYLLLGLAVCDFLTGAVSIPYFIIFNFNVVPSRMFDQFAFWMFALHTFMAVSAAYHILVITAEKYLAILQPLRLFQGFPECSVKSARAKRFTFYLSHVVGLWSLSFNSLVFINK